MFLTHRAASGAALARGLADVLAARRPTRSPRRSSRCRPRASSGGWLSGCRTCWARSAGDGVCANVAFPWPSTLVDEARAVGVDRARRGGRAVGAGRAVWPLLEVIDASSPAEPWCRSLAQHLGTDAEDKGRRLAVARRLAPAVRRVRAVPAGDAARLGRRPGRAGRRHPAGRRPAWQAELWRRLRDRLGTPSPAELLDDACARLRDEPTLSDLPDAALGLRRQPALARAAAGARRARRAPRRAPVAAPPLARAVGHRRGVPPRRAPHGRHRPQPADQPAAAPPVPRRPRAAAAHRPHRTGQPDRLTLRRHTPTPCSAGSSRTSPTTASRPPPPPLDDADRSVQVHACHGRTRQVEVLREVIVGLLADDPTLEPRDVLVMCPDVETFAPIIAATFALGAEDDAAHPAAELRVRLADRALRQTNAAARRAVPAARARHRPAHRQPGARPRRHARGAAAVRVRRRRARAAARLDRRAPASGGASTASTAPPGSSATSSRAAGTTGSTGCCSAPPWRARSTAGATSYRSTTSTAPTSTWPAGSPSWSTGSPPRSS